MGSTPPLIKIDCHLECFFRIRVPSDKFYFDFLLLRFSVEILGESIGIQFSAIFVLQFNKGFNRI